MANTLIFPDGIRLCTEDELPGPDDHHNRLWKRVQSANIIAGYFIKETPEGLNPFYAEANVDSPDIWNVFCDLCRCLLGPYAKLIMSQIDDEPKDLGTARTALILDLLGENAYQLANDGWLQFGLIDAQNKPAAEVFIAPTKHFQVWFKDLVLFRSIMTAHSICETDHLEFIDEYPRTTTRLPDEKVLFRDHEKLIIYLWNNLEQGDRRKL